MGFNEKVYYCDNSASLSTIRDPMVLVYDGKYYVTGTQPPYWQETGTNEGVRLWSTEDFEHFEFHGIILHRKDMPESMWCRERFWAPELFATKNGKFILTVSCRNETQEYGTDFGIAVAYADNITGPYTLMTPDVPVATRIDATIFEDDDGSLYLGATTGESLTMYKFDEETCRAEYIGNVCAKGNEGEWDSAGIEGQCIIKRHGIYFQWYSSWTNGYAAGILTSDNIRGPWKKSPLNPILSEDDVFYRAGHNHSFRSIDGKDYIVFHAELRDNPDGIERMFMRRVEYLPDGTVKILKS